MSGTPFRKNTNGSNLLRKKSPLPNARKPASTQKSYGWGINYPPSFNVSPVRSYSRPTSSLLYNHLESPFYEKKMNDPSNLKYKNKLKKQQQYWNYSNRKGNFPVGRPFNTFANGRLTNRTFDNLWIKGFDILQRSNLILSILVPSVKVTDLDYALNYSYLNQVIPPSRDAIEEYNRAPLDMSKCCFFEFENFKTLFWLCEVE